MATMRLTYDADADAAFLYFVGNSSTEQSSRTEMCDVEFDKGAVILLFDVDDRLMGLEILGASRLLSAEVLARAASAGGQIDT
jgi:uncharacterized protein YuzE